MRRIFALTMTAVLVLLLAVGASAATGASKIQSIANITGDGGCQVTMVVTLHLEESVPDLCFPVPDNARNVTLNGSNVFPRREGEALMVDLSKTLGGITGDFTVNISYTLSNCISRTNRGSLELTVPLLSGFLYPVELLEFTVTLPGEFSEKPAFSSGYWQSSIESDLTYEIVGVTVTGNTIKQLKDRETLVMTLPVTEELFPQAPAEIRLDVALDDTAMLICGILALVYWLIFLRCLPPRRARRVTPPDGLTAGEMGCALVGSGVDLTAMVVTWAQLGYILIQLDNNGRVLLHKRMDMGNERGSFEVRIFRSLFGKKRMVDGTGLQYALLCRKVAAAAPNVHDLYRPGSGNPRIFRVLAAGIGLFGGISLGLALAEGSAMRWLLVFLMAVLGGIGSWWIQSAVYCLHLRRTPAVWTGLISAAVWLALGLLAGETGVAVTVILTQLAAGAAAAYGGRRSELGRQTMSQVLGLRRYLRTVSRKELFRLSRSDPEFYHTLAPYALALGVDRAFARRFGGTRLPRCPYLTTGMDGHLTAAEWCQLLRRAVNTLDYRQKRLTLERLTSLTGK